MWHFLHRKPHWTKMKNNYWGIILGLGQESLGIFEQYMTQRNYENYLGIFGWTEMKFNYWGIILGLGQESLGIFEQHITQRNYENYLGIFGWTEI